MPPARGGFRSLHFGKNPADCVKFIGGQFLTPPDFLRIASKETADSYPTADLIFEKIAAWLQTTGVGHLVSSTLIEDFAINRRAYFECECMNKRLGRIANGKRSPYVDMAIQYSGLMRTAWDRIWAIVSQNSEKLLGSNQSGGEDVMERLLSAAPNRRGGK